MGRQPSRGAPTYKIAKFSEKLHEIENILGHKGSAPVRPLQIRQCPPPQKKTETFRFISINLYSYSPPPPLNLSHNREPFCRVSNHYIWCDYDTRSLRLSHTETLKKGHDTMIHNKLLTANKAPFTIQIAFRFTIAT